MTGEQVLTPYAISRALSVMTSSGMYDYAGEWIYRVGIPAKSGVGGGILAALPARLGLGSYSPRLDSHGNSVRGIKVCEALSLHYDLHMLNRSDDARNSIIADYNIGKSASRRSRRPHEQKIIAAHHQDVRIIELVGTLTFANADYVSRQLAGKPRPQFIIFDLRRVAAMTRAGARLLAEGFRELAAFNVTAIISGIKRSSAEWEPLGEWVKGVSNLRNFHLLDDAIEWAEDQIVYRHGGTINSVEVTELSEQPLLAGLSADELARIAALGMLRTYQPGQRIIATAEPAASLFFLKRGVVHVRLPDGVRLATITAGMTFGEMALFENNRSADVLADKFRHRPRNPATRFSAFSGRASTDRRTHHAQFGAIARRAADRGQHQDKFADGELTIGRSDHFRHRLHVDAEGLQEFRRHDVETDGELQFDQRRRRQLRCDGIEGRVGRAAHRNDLVGKGQCRALHLVKAGRGLPVLQRRVLLVGNPDIFADALVRDDFIRRLAQNSRSRDRELPHHRVQFTAVADRAAEAAILLKIAWRMRHHPKNIGVTILAQDLAGAFVRFRSIAIIDTGHHAPWVSGVTILPCRTAG